MPATAPPPRFAYFVMPQSCDYFGTEWRHDDVMKWKYFSRYWRFGTGGFPSQRPVARSFDVFFDLCLNTRSSEQWRHRWMETPSWPLWRHCNGSNGQRHWLMSASESSGNVGKYAQWTRHAMITSLLRQNEVATSFCRNNDVIIMSCDHWVATGNVVAGRASRCNMAIPEIDCNVRSKISKFVYQGDVKLQNLSISFPHIYYVYMNILIYKYMNI